MLNILDRKIALLVIDVQEGFDDPMWGHRNNPQAEANIATLLGIWRENKLPIFHVQHLSRNTKWPFHPTKPGSRIKKIVAPLPNESLIQKNVNSAFIGTNLETSLRQQAIKAVVVTGLTTDHCVSTTARMAGNLGFQTYVVSDATATFDRLGPDGKKYSAEEIHETSLVSLHEEFATIVTMEELVRTIGKDETKS